MVRLTMNFRCEKDLHDAIMEKGGSDFMRQVLAKAVGRPELAGRIKRGRPKVQIYGGDDEDTAA